MDVNGEFYDPAALPPELNPVNWKLPGHHRRCRRSGEVWISDLISLEHWFHMTSGQH